MYVGVEAGKHEPINYARNKIKIQGLENFSDNIKKTAVALIKVLHFCNASDKVLKPKLMNPQDSNLSSFLFQLLTSP